MVRRVNRERRKFVRPNCQRLHTGLGTASQVAVRVVGVDLRTDSYHGSHRSVGVDAPPERLIHQGRGVPVRPDDEDAPVRRINNGIRTLVEVARIGRRLLVEGVSTDTERRVAADRDWCRPTAPVRARPMREHDLGRAVPAGIVIPDRALRSREELRERDVDV